MILTTTIKHSYTTTGHNNKGYIFTLYLFMLLCVVGNCLLFYCSCTGNCENCCGINGNASVSGGSISVSESENDEYENENMIENDKKNNSEINNQQNNESKSGMFYNCSSLKELDLSKFNTNKVTNMNHMFANNSGLTKLDLPSSFNTNNVTNMNGMFYGSSKLTNIKFPDNLNTTNVTDMSCMFYYCSSLTILDLSKFNTTKVINMSYMFYNCSSLTNINLSNFDTRNVKDMSFMFYGCSKLTNLNISSFNTNNVTNMRNMFYNCFKEKQPSILICKASTIKHMTEDKNNSCLKFVNNNVKIVIENNNNLEQVYTCIVKRKEKDINPQITSVVESDKAGLFKLKNMPESGKIDDIQIVDTNFAKAELVKYVQIVGNEYDKQMIQDSFMASINPTGETHLSAYVEVKDNGKVKLRCFIHCTDANSILYDYGDHDVLFDCSEATKIEILSCGSEITNMSYMFYNCSKLTVLNLSNFNTSNVTSMHRMFCGCSGLQNLNLSSLDTNKVTNMYCMFSECSSLKELDLSSFNTNNVTDISYMFDNCISLTNIKLSSFNTTNVTDMSWMFSNCSKLTNLNLSSFNTINVTNMSGMFSDCSSLTNINLSKFNTTNVTDMRYMFDNCFKKNQTSTLICKASTIKNITDKTKNSCLIITNENKKRAKINNIIGNNKNLVEVYIYVM